MSWPNAHKTQKVHTPNGAPSARWGSPRHITRTTTTTGNALIIYSIFRHLDRDNVAFLAIAMQAATDVLYGFTTVPALPLLRGTMLWLAVS